MAPNIEPQIDLSPRRLTVGRALVFTAGSLGVGGAGAIAAEISTSPEVVFAGDEICYVVNPDGSCQLWGTIPPDTPNPPGGGGSGGSGGGSGGGNPGGGNTPPAPSFSWSKYYTDNGCAPGEGEPDWAPTIEPDTSRRIFKIISDCPDGVMVMMIEDPRADVSHTQEQVDKLQALIANKNAPTTTQPLVTTPPSTEVATATTVQPAETTAATTSTTTLAELVTTIADTFPDSTVTTLVPNTQSGQPTTTERLAAPAVYSKPNKDNGSNREPIFLGAAVIILGAAGVIETRRRRYKAHHKNNQQKPGLGGTFPAGAAGGR